MFCSVASAAMVAAVAAELFVRATIFVPARTQSAMYGQPDRIIRARTASALNKRNNLWHRFGNLKLEFLFIVVAAAAAVPTCSVWPYKH
jgi:hypothetical protein